MVVGFRVPRLFSGQNLSDKLNRTQQSFESDRLICGFLDLTLTITMSAEVQTCGKPIQTLVEHVVNVNILSSEYFKELYRLKTFHEVVDEIYNHVAHVVPWMTGNSRGPSPAFCLLCKFFTMKLTDEQVQEFLNHADSPYVCAV
ncbi:pre-mRNA splicing factor SR-like 1 [Selaginella moellendorffii]|uniref:pre-mRNA splicing factor SR-like 1 n=1 Tax=Selaginella moellendorffii TaxID=88036 RepID=UPI000D1CE18B|nr:pre-mRNA splicing factor SR-like 1 [Selaginella moellendorffii]|eukprot:XP_024543804.1 pre-mRNA splicing factor SR-like 1 [Selaginella moellendorffii]